VRTAKGTPFELRRLQRIGDLSKGNAAMTMDCMEVAALERRIAALEKGLSPPAHDRLQTGAIAAKSSSRPIGASVLSKLTREGVGYLDGTRCL
jgi:hypothetical protein